MKATHESTSADDRERERREGSLLWARTKPLLDERDSLKAEVQRLQAAKQPAPDPDKIQAMKDRARHAGTTHSNDIHCAIDAMVERYRLQLVNWTGTDTSRACWLTRRIYPDAKTDKAGRPYGWRTVYNHLKTLSV